ncbi:MAG: hypothetical protein JW915_11090 [Chitinispirillaceae bacterium]|nr:hypothetical protein [Chitinispirillaceae bacterium]
MDLLSVDLHEYVPDLADLVEYSKKHIPFYSRLYRQHNTTIETLDQFSSLPYINEGTLIRERLEDMVLNLDDVHEICYPTGRLVSDCCMPRVQSQQDQEEQYCILEWILETSLLIDCSKDKPSIALLSDEHNSYSAAAFCKMVILLLNSPFFALIERGHTAAEINKELSQGKPDIVITSGTFSRECIPDTVHTVIDIGDNPIARFSDKSIHYCHVLSHPLLGIIGCSVDNPGFYHYNPDYYFIESSQTNAIVYTSFMQKLMPIVRLRSHHWGKLITPGLFQITYLGTH